MNPVIFLATTAEPHPVTAALSDEELQAHIADCGHHLEVAYERFQAFGDPADRDAALFWLHAQQEAQQALSQAAKDRREAEIMASILDEGVDYFQVAGARDAARAAERCA